MKTKITYWLRQPRNIVFVIVLIIIGIYGIVNDNLDVIMKVYFVMFLFGLLVRGIIFLKNRFSKND